MASGLRKKQYRQGVRATKYFEELGSDVETAVGETGCDYSLQDNGFYSNPDHDDLGTPRSDWPSSMRLGILPYSIDFRVGKSRCLLKVEDLPDIFPTLFGPTTIQPCPDIVRGFPPSGEPIHLLSSGCAFLSCWHVSDFKQDQAESRHRSWLEKRDAIVSGICEEVRDIAAIPSTSPNLLFRTSVHVSMHTLKEALLKAGIEIVMFAQEHRGQGCLKDTIRHLDRYAERAGRHIRFTAAFRTDSRYNMLLTYNAYEIGVHFRCDRVCLVGSYKETPGPVRVKVHPMLPGMLMNDYGSIEIDLKDQGLGGDQSFTNVCIESRLGSHAVSLRGGAETMTEKPTTEEQFIRNLRWSRGIVEELASTDMALVDRQAGGICIKLTVAKEKASSAIDLCRTTKFHEPTKLFDEVGLFKETTDGERGNPRRWYPVQRIPLQVVITHAMRVVSAGFSASVLRPTDRPTDIAAMSADVAASLGLVNPSLPCSKYEADNEFWVHGRERRAQELRTRQVEKRRREMEEGKQGNEGGPVGGEANNAAYSDDRSKKVGCFAHCAPCSSTCTCLRTNK